jgi:hypothetical protein
MMCSTSILFVALISDLPAGGVFHAAFAGVD